MTPRAARFRRPSAPAGRRAAEASSPKRRWAALLPLVAGVLPLACQEQLPTSAREDLVPAGILVEVTLPFDQFASNLRVYGGFGRASESRGAFLAHEFGTTAAGPARPSLAAKTLVRFGTYPSSASVRDTAGTLRTDSAIAFVSGRIAAVFDAPGTVAAGPVEVVAHEIAEAWDGTSATWSHAVDTLNGRVPWSETGGGPPREVARAAWDPAGGDTLFLQVDSASVHAWADTASGVHGVRLETSTRGARVELRSAFLSLRALPSINPDTMLDLAVPVRRRTFVYDPSPPPPAPGEARVGGVPAWRSVLDLDVPDRLDGPPYLCAAVQCPVRLDDSRVSYAALQLVSRAPPSAFAPSDSLAVEVRPVLAPDFLPKSPLGAPATGLAGAPLAAQWFAPPAGKVVEVPITALVRDLLRSAETDGAVSSTIALLAPLSLAYVSFEGADPERAPRLRLILSFSEAGR